MCAAHKHNYSRYGLYYVRSITWFPPDILEKFCSEEQSLHHIPGLNNGMWSDMFIETTQMHKGHQPGGIIGDTQSSQTMATWAHSMDATMSLTSDLQNISGEAAYKKNTHKEESQSRIVADDCDRRSLNATLKSCIDPMDPQTHKAGCLLNISSGEVAKPSVNVDSAPDFGKELLECFEMSWAEGFYDPIPSKVVTLAEKKNTIPVGGSGDIDPEAIYARVSGLLISQRELDLNQVLSTELTANPPSMFTPGGQMHPASNMSALKRMLQVEVSRRTVEKPNVFVVDVSALWRHLNGQCQALT